MSNNKKTKAAIISHLIAEKEASYKNMMAMQKSEMASAAKSSEGGEGQFHGGKMDQTRNRIEARSSVVEALQRDINILAGLDSIEANDEIQLGDVVETDKGNFFVAVPADEFIVDGVSYRGISADSPLFQALMGKKSGDTVVINDNRFTLKNSY